MGKLLCRKTHGEVGMVLSCALYGAGRVPQPGSAPIPALCCELDVGGDSAPSPRRECKSIMVSQVLGRALGDCGSSGSWDPCARNSGQYELPWGNEIPDPAAWRQSPLSFLEFEAKERVSKGQSAKRTFLKVSESSVSLSNTLVAGRQGQSTGGRSAGRTAMQLQHGLLPSAIAPLPLLPSSEGR